MTLEEKIGLIHGSGLFRNAGIPRLGIPPLMMSDGPMGVRYEFRNAEWIPDGHSDDWVTYLPSGCAIASTWNPDLALAYGRVLGEEARGRKKDVILAPSINIIRSPLCGRNFEYLSEDPYLTSRMAVNMVRGIQENDVAACVKHFAANNQETNRLSVDVIVKEKTLHEIYFPAFKACVQEANAYAIMGAYNKINGEHCSQSRTLLNQILRDQWGFQNMVISDWSAVNNTLEAAKSGIDIEMSVHSRFDDYYLANPLMKLIQEGAIQESLIDEKVRNILTSMDKLKMLRGSSHRNKGSYNTPLHREIAYQIATESIVLLKNQNHVLPITQPFKKILVVGDNATRVHSQGGGSAEIKALYEITPLMALKSKLGGNTQIDYVPGYFVPTEEQNAQWQETSLASKYDERESLESIWMEKQVQLRDEAVLLAKDYDYVFYFGGLNHLYDLEAQDRSHLGLPYQQDELIQSLLNQNPNTIVYLLSGSSLDLSKWDSRCHTLLWSSYYGMEGANALIDIVFGKIAPSGKLTQTFDYSLSQYPSHSIGEFPGTTHVRYSEETHVGYRHFLNHDIEPAFCFGHGLSYTTFEYHDFDIRQDQLNVSVDFQITNRGTTDAKEIAQLYVASGSEKIRVLKAFKKVMINAHETVQVTLSLDKTSFQSYDESLHQFVVTSGEYCLSIGPSVANLYHSETIRI